MEPGTDAVQRAVDLPQRRLNFRFCATGTGAACLACDRNGRLLVESWSLGVRGWEAVPLAAAAGETVHTQPVATLDGRVVVVRSNGRMHEAAVLSAVNGHVVEQTLTTLHCKALRAIPSQDPATLAWLVAFNQPDRTVIHRIDAHRLDTVTALETPGRLRGEFWLTETGDLLAANHFLAGQRRVSVLDLARGTLAPMTGAGDATVLLTSPRSGRILVATGTPTGTRLGWTALDHHEISHPDELNRISGVVWPLALDPTGNRLALRVTHGARSRLLVYDADADTTTEVNVPPGVIRTAAWGDSGLHVLFSSPTRPSVVATVDDPNAPDRPALTALGRPDPRWHDARLEWFSGPAGPIETIVYGPDWRRARHLLVALHGGPEAAWDLAFDPIFQRFASAGITVVAPNQRGSTGYGAAHREALSAGWGGPDLADIRSLRAAFACERRGPNPMLYGVSYGAYLALIAAAADPGAWSRCAVVAPFVDGPSLRKDGPPGVRAMLDRLGGCVPVLDHLGPRNLLRLGTRIRSPLLVIHGERDEVIPVAHSRHLVERLRRTNHALTYREVPGGGHNPLDEADGGALLDDVVDFYLGT